MHVCSTEVLALVTKRLCTILQAHTQSMTLKALRNKRFVENRLRQVQIFYLEHMILFVQASCLLLLGEFVIQFFMCLLCFLTRGSIGEVTRIPNRKRSHEDRVTDRVFQIIFEVSCQVFLYTPALILLDQIYFQTWGYRLSYRILPTQFCLFTNYQLWPLGIQTPPQT